MPRASQREELELSGHADEVRDFASFKSLIEKLTHSLSESVKSQTVNSANKRLIKKTADEILKATQVLETKMEFSDCFEVPSSAQPNDAIPKPLEEGILAAIRQGIREEINNIPAPLPRAPSRTYADTARAPQPKVLVPQRSLPSIIIKSTETGPDQPNVLDQWKNKVSFRDTCFAPTKVKPLGKNVVRVDFDRKEHCAEAMKRVNAVPGMKAEDARKRKPLVILKGISKDIKKEELLPIIAQQNSVPVEDLRLCFPLKNRNENLYNVVLEVQPTIRKRFVEAERINLDHQRVRVTDFSRFVQCFKCLQFGHTNNKCKAEYYPCSHCASTAHAYANCPVKTNPDKLKCINCDRFNQRTGSSVNTKHSATNDKLCSRIINTKQLINETIDFGNETD